MCCHLATYHRNLLDQSVARELSEGEAKIRNCLLRHLRWSPYIRHRFQVSLSVYGKGLARDFEGKACVCSDKIIADNCGWKSSKVLIVLR